MELPRLGDELGFSRARLWGSRPEFGQVLQVSLVAPALAAAVARHAELCGAGEEPERNGKAQPAPRLFPRSQGPTRGAVSSAAKRQNRKQSGAVPTRLV